ncbi:MAG: hypothetical protein J6K52_01530 [Clostridia bacterium]|nr:hypothetical protein [Clostridia bacterium]MBQ7788336.1 hypothetical protein [Clostridia bacterium]
MKFDGKKNTNGKRVFTLDGKMVFSNVDPSLDDIFKVSNNQAPDDFYKAKEIYTSGKSMDIIKLGENEEKRAFVKVLNDGFSTSIEVSLIENGRSDELIENDRKMLATFPEIIGENGVARVNIFNFFKKTVGVLKKDVRFAYRTFKIDVDKKNELTTYIYHLQILAIATLAIMNSFSYKSPIRIAVDKNGDFCRIEFETKTDESVNFTSKESIIKEFADVEMRVNFIESLCNKDGIGFYIEHTNKRLVIAYELTDEPTTKKRLLSTVQRDLMEFTRKYMDIFNYSIIDTEEQEGEE